MLIAVPTEVNPDEKRVAATPETVKKYCASGYQVLVQKGAGSGAYFPDSDYEVVGAKLAESGAELYGQADIILKVKGPDKDELRQMVKNTVLVGMLAPATNPLIQAYAEKGLTCFSLELLPRISRAQNMDVLSSQANIGGYKAVLLAAQYYERFFPLLMTAAGTVKPARVLILGAGVAGLQAIATARRLGAMVEVFDVRPAVKEQVESLGAKFVEVETESEEDAETSGGYAREMSEEYKQKQAQLIQERAIDADIIITTALIPGKPAPRLISENTVREMKPGSVIVDMAVEMGGNCTLSEMDQVVVRHGVTLIGVGNIPALMATDASQLYARNLFNFLTPMLAEDGGVLNINLEDEVINASLLCKDGELLTPQSGNQGGKQ
ncbi:MAG: Re/Si-specific NAD(P)(+) transhydrogenase subunit alpha [Mariprofundaceae bacterium]